MILTDRVCLETNFPMCRHISDEICGCASRGFSISNLKIASPTTVLLLTAAILSTTRMIGHVKALCSSTGRKEMLMFFYLYLVSITLEIVLVGWGDTFKHAHLFLSTIQTTLYSSALFLLFVGSMTVDMFVGVLGFRAETLLKVSTAIYSIGMGALIFTGLSTGSGEMISIPFFILNTLFLFLYFIFQLRRLRKTNGEVWAYGTLLISMACFMGSSGIMFIGSKLIGLLTDRYFDNLFFHNFLVLCTFIMIHKYWLSVYNYEVESLQLEV